MNSHLIIDEAGRIVIPKPLREQLHLEPGDALEMESAGEQITLRPVRGTAPLRKEHGVWVFHTRQSLSASATEAVLRELREECDTTNWRADIPSASSWSSFLRSRPKWRFSRSRKLRIRCWPESREDFAR